jgi:alpha-tubulin suppressor-like RCC1 family protein
MIKERWRLFAPAVLAAGCSRTALDPEASLPTTPEAEHVCPVDFADCDGDPSNGCEVDLASSRESCGACDHRCDEDLFCGAGVCRPGDDIVQVALGGWYSCVRRASGQVLCWGENRSGQLGDGTTSDRKEPAVVQGLDDAVEISAAGRHMCARRTGETVVCWGGNRYEQLGDGTSEDRSHPVEVDDLSSVAHIAAGGWHVLALGLDGVVRFWGDKPCDCSDSEPHPTAVPGSSGAIAVKAAGTNCLQRGDRTLACWGGNIAGTIGDGTRVLKKSPVPVKGLGEVITMDTGPSQTCAVRESGGVSCWGDDYGELPVRVLGVEDVVQVVVGSHHQCARRASGGVVCWGWNTITEPHEVGGMLGAGDFDEHDGPVEVLGVTDAVDISAGSAHTCALLRDSRVVCWGGNKYGQLGDGTTELRNAPVEVLGLP